MLLFCETNQISKTPAILSEKTLNNLSFCKHFPRFPNPNCNFRSKIFFATIILGYSAWICNADLSNKTVLHAFHRFYLINLLKKKGALNKATTSKRKAGGWSSKMCCSWGCGKFNFLLNTQCLEPTSKEVFAQDIYLNGERILHNQQQFKGKLHLGKKVAHPSSSSEACLSTLQAVPCMQKLLYQWTLDKIFGKKPVPNPDWMPVAEKHNLLNQLHSAIKLHVNRKDTQKQLVLR